MTIAKSEETEDRDFYDAQSFGGDKYFMYIIDQNGQTSCYFWFSSPAQLLNAIKVHMDFWEWREGWDEASEELEKIIDSHPNPTRLDDTLCGRLNAYIDAHAGIRIWAWGKFEEVVSGNERFSVEVRTEFREHMNDSDGNDGMVSADCGNPASPIREDELDNFIEYIFNRTT